MNTPREVTDHPEPVRALRPTIYCPPERADRCVVALRRDHQAAAWAPDEAGRP